MKTVQEIFAQAVLPENVEAFRALLIKQAEMHDDYSELSNNALAKRGAEVQRGACLRAYDYAAHASVDDLCNDWNVCIIALNVAAKQFGLAPWERTQALIAWSDAREASEGKS